MKIKLKFILTYIIFVIVMLISLFFGSSFENWLKLKPNLNDISKSALEVHFVDVGQGDAILIKNNNKTMLIDSGPAACEKQLLTYIDNVFFRDENSKTFNYVVLTHSDMDHSGNMLTILNNYKVETFFRPKIFVEGLESVGEKVLYDNSNGYAKIISKLNSLQNENVTTVKYAEMGICFGLDDAEVNILAPVKNYYSSGNNYSAVLTVEKYGKKFMFTGDADKTNETEIINNNNLDLLDVDVLKIAHHGGADSTSANFLEITTPSYAVISVGTNNVYNHPSSEVLNTISSYNFNKNTTIKTLQTATVGNILFYVNGENNLKHTTIQSVFDYLFISWWVLVLLIIATVTIIAILIILIKWLKVGKTAKL